MLQFYCCGFIMAVQIKILMMFVVGMFQATPQQGNRCIYIFADKESNSYAIQQVNILKADPNGIKTRLITYKTIIWSPENAEYYKKCGVPNAPFTVILIGSDNGEKLRSHQPVSLAKLYDLIDNMSMRKIQIQYKH